jgi:hypothetical protein
MPELKKVFDNQLDYNNIYLFLVVYDTFIDKIEKIKIDWRHPENIRLG